MYVFMCLWARVCTYVHATVCVGVYVRVRACHGSSHRMWMARGLGVSQRWWKSLTDGQLGREGGMGCTVEQATEWGTRGGGGGGGTTDPEA